MGRSSVIVDDLHVVGVAVLPGEADPSLVVDPDAELAAAITLQRLEVVPWRHAEVREDAGAVQVEQAPASYAFNRPEPPHRHVGEERLGVGVPEGSDH